MRTAGILRACCLTIASTAAAWAAVPPKTIYVDRDAPGASTGTSWLNAFNYLQDGLGSAIAGDTIRVAQGTYKPNEGTAAPTGRTATFQLKTGVKIYGGYAGYGAPIPNKRDVALYPTVLSGDLDGNDVIVEINDANLVRYLLTAPTRQDNAYNVVTGTGAEPNAVLDGFVIFGGNANGPDAWPYSGIRGGGLFSYGGPPASQGSPTVRNCTFTANAATDGGGALSNYQNESLIEKCTFKGNYSKKYGAGVTNSAANPVIVDCNFVWNNAYYNTDGGAVYCYDSNPVLSGCIFMENYGGQEGGALFSSYSDPNVMDCQFIGNSSDLGGGAVWNNTGAYPTFTRCTFIRNYTGEWGGAMANYSCTPTLTACAFIGNKSNNGAGGAMYNRGSTPLLVNCLFNGNTASETGGGLGNYNTDIRVINCTFAANFAPQGNAVGCEPGGTTDKSHVTLTNGILWDGGAEIYKSVDDVVDVTYSDVQGAWAGTGNIAANPLFVNAHGTDFISGNEDDNLRLAAHSPCIDAGANYALPIDVTVDLDGRTRFVDDPATANTGNGTPPIVDMGAYEFGSSPVPPANHVPVADAGADQTVFADLTGYASVALDGSGSYDVDGDSLSYYWSWTIGAHTYQTSGVSPTIQLPIGPHTITLFVFDGTDYSSADEVEITVEQQQAPLDADVWIYPYQIVRSGGSPYVYVIARLFDVHSNEVDLSVLLTLSPGGVQAVSQDVYESTDSSGVTTTVLAIFHKSDVTGAIPQNGVITLTVTGQLTSGQAFTGTDAVKISNT